jgi:hypothetical protein
MATFFITYVATCVRYLFLPVADDLCTCLQKLFLESIALQLYFVFESLPNLAFMGLGVIVLLACTQPSWINH